MATQDHIADLPDELVEAIIAFLPPADTIAFGLTSQRHHKITSEPLIWRRHCIQGWKHWASDHNFDELLLQPPASVRWRQLYNQRQETDRLSLNAFEDLLSTQQLRIERTQRIAARDFDAADLLMKLRDRTPDDAEDVLARTYHASATIGHIWRRKAIEIWKKLKDDKPVLLEEAAFSLDMFVYKGAHGGFERVKAEYDRLAGEVRSRHPDFETYHTRQKACSILEYLRAGDLLGNPDPFSYHALRNNFTSLTLFEEPHTSLPLQSAVIYCAVARRLGVDASPCGFPTHVFVIVQSPQGTTLDGAPSPPYSSIFDARDPTKHTMHLDPWRSSEVVPSSLLRRMLNEMGVPAGMQSTFLTAATVQEIVLRAARNMDQSVAALRQTQDNSNEWLDTYYCTLWLDVLFGGVIMRANMSTAGALLHCYEDDFPQDSDLLEQHILPTFASHPEFSYIAGFFEAHRKADAMKPVPKHRDASPVKFKVGYYFKHRRYGYHAVITGWDNTCEAGQQWINQMRVGDLSRGEHQPFYHAVVEGDKTTRYVAEENIQEASQEPAESMLKIAGKWFKRWDREQRTFISNIKDSYPED